MTEPLPRLGLRPNPDAPLGYDVYLYDDGNAWTGWLRIEYVPTEMDDPTRGGALTGDGQRDLIELLPMVGDPS